MSLWDWADREESENEILRDIRTALANLVAQSGETQLAQDIQLGMLHDYVTVPQNGSVLGVPGGTLRIDFKNGRAEHSALSAPIVDNDEMRSIADLDVDVSRLRSLAMGVDTPGFIRLDDGDRAPVKPGQFIVQAQRFEEIELEFEYPASIALGASTRSDPHVEANTQVQTGRTGGLPTAQYDSWTDVPVYPLTLPQYVSSPSSYAEPEISVDGNSTTTFVVENTSGNGNAIDVRVVVDAGYATDFRQTGDVVDAVADGDHTIINLAETHRLAKVQIQNNTNGDDVGCEADVTGRMS